jgi:hypothetical protein
VPILKFKLGFLSQSFKTFLKQNSKQNTLQRYTLKTSALSYDLSCPLHMDEISFPFLDFHSLMQISSPFLLIDESCTNTISKVKPYAMHAF